jgi:hypothetical protein
MQAGNVSQFLVWGYGSIGADVDTVSRPEHELEISAGAQPRALDGEMQSGCEQRSEL